MQYGEISDVWTNNFEEIKSKKEKFKNNSQKKFNYNQQNLKKNVENFNIKNKKFKLEKEKFNNDLKKFKFQKEKFNNSLIKLKIFFLDKTNILLISLFILFFILGNLVGKNFSKKKIIIYPVKSTGSLELEKNNSSDFNSFLQKYIKTISNF